MRPRGGIRVLLKPIVHSVWADMSWSEVMLINHHVLILVEQTRSSEFQQNISSKLEYTLDWVKANPVHHPDLKYAGFLAKKPVGHLI